MMSFSLLLSSFEKKIISSVSNDIYCEPLQKTLLGEYSDIYVLNKYLLNAIMCQNIKNYI